MRPAGAVLQAGRAFGLIAVPPFARRRHRHIEASPDPLQRLPRVDPSEPLTAAHPGKNTEAAIRLGIESALVGGVHSLISLFADTSRVPPWVFVTGGGYKLLGDYRSDAFAEMRIVPALTLDGIRIAAEALP